VEAVYSQSRVLGSLGDSPTCADAIDGLKQIGPIVVAAIIITATVECK